MSEPKFTPGPWRVREGTSIVTSETSDVAIVVGQVTHGTLTTQRSQSNARLIAAAPTLYDALVRAKKTIRTFNGMGMSGETEKACWNAYQSSPEMKQINAALALVESEAA